MAAGNIIGFDGNIDKWVLYRENSSTQQVEHITNLDGEIQKYIDYTGLKGQSYRYYIYAQSGSKMSNAFVTNYVDMDYYGYFLIDKTNERVYVFDTNVGDNAISKIWLMIPLREILSMLLMLLAIWIMLVVTLVDWLEVLKVSKWR